MRAAVFSAIMLAACLSQAQARPDPFGQKRFVCTFNVCEYFNSTANRREACYLQSFIGPTLSVQGDPLYCFCHVNSERYTGLVKARRQNC